MKHTIQKGFAMPVAIITAVILVVLTGALYLYMSQPAVENDALPDAAIQQEEQKTTGQNQEAGTIIKSGSYEAYSPEKLSLAASGDVVLFFRAPWCPTCRALDANIRANMNNIPAGVVILDVNYDDSTALKQKYGVTYQHTLVQVDAQGNQIAKWSSSLTLASLVANIK